MAVLRILNAGGDARIDWDERAYAAGDPEAVAAVEEAERLFAEARHKGASAFRVQPGEPAVRITSLSPTLSEEVLIVPPMIGG